MGMMLKRRRQDPKVQMAECDSRLKRYNDDLVRAKKTQDKDWARRCEDKIESMELTIATMRGSAPVKKVDSEKVYTDSKVEVVTEKPKKGKGK